LGKHSHPLSGKIVVNTRAPEQSQELSDALEALGADVRHLPMVSFAPLENSEHLDSALRRFPEFDWVLFTSQNAVRFVFRRGCELKSRRPAQPPRPLIAAVGTATAQAARNLDIRVDYVAQNQTGESLAAELRKEMAGMKVFLPRSDRADDRLPAALRASGADVLDVVAYRTTMPESVDSKILDSIRNAAVNLVVFASPSAFGNFRAAIAPAGVAELSNKVQFAAIGPTTANAIREAGAQVAVEANASSATGLAEAIAEYYKKPPTTARQS
jgi:uroporphyrinogen-III synthase